MLMISLLLDTTAVVENSCWMPWRVRLAAMQFKLVHARFVRLYCCVCQIVSAKEIRRILSHAEVQRLPLPELRSCSKILENHHIRQVGDKNTGVVCAIVVTQQLRRQNFCSRGISPVELSSSPAA